MPKNRRPPSPKQVLDAIKSIFGPKFHSDIKDELLSCANLNSGSKRAKQLLKTVDGCVGNCKIRRRVGAIKSIDTRDTLRDWKKGTQDLLNLAESGDGFTKAAIAIAGFRDIAPELSARLPIHMPSEDCYPYSFAGREYPIGSNPFIRGKSDFPILKMYLRKLLSSIELAQTQILEQEFSELSPEYELVMKLSARFGHFHNRGRPKTPKDRRVIQVKKIEFIRTVTDKLGLGLKAGTIERILRKPPPEWLGV